MHRHPLRSITSYPFRQCSLPERIDRSRSEMELRQDLAGRSLENRIAGENSAEDLPHPHLGEMKFRHQVRRHYGHVHAPHPQIA